MKACEHYLLSCQCSQNSANSQVSFQTHFIHFVSRVSYMEALNNVCLIFSFLHGHSQDSQVHFGILWQNVLDFRFPFRIYDWGYRQIDADYFFFLILMTSCYLAQSILERMSKTLILHEYFLRIAYWNIYWGMARCTHAQGWYWNPMAYPYLKHIQISVVLTTSCSMRKSVQLMNWYDFLY